MRLKLVRGDEGMTRKVVDLLGRAHDVRAVEAVGDDVGGADAVVVVWPSESLGRTGAMRLIERLGSSRALAVVPVTFTVDRLGIVESAIDYVADPYHPLELLRRLDALGGHARKRGAVWRAGNLMLDEGARQVERGGRRIDLTRKEFDLLRELVRNRGMVQERSALLEAVWSSQDYNPNVIEVTMSSLRHKVEAHGPRILHTVRGIGYVCRVDHEPTTPLSDLVGERDHLVEDRQRLMAQRNDLIEQGRARRASDRGAPSDER